MNSMTSAGILSVSERGKKSNWHIGSCLPAFDSQQHINLASLPKDYPEYYISTRLILGLLALSGKSSHGMMEHLTWKGESIAH
ncbi:hypothetical protein SAY87_013119 [Trapa incisa]|uniref:Uncharacterized protein n=1 Tax=Trapa incisa TaxID=236973 RepID=A0AAN7QCG2_9MYRT|nr:hypothetical protein SAY87_013119 [Trapa incisa]